MVRIFIHIVVLLIFSTLLVVSLGVGVLSIKQEVESPMVFGCGVISEYDDAVDEPMIDHPGRTVFENNCMVCHATNQVVVGPALRGVSERRDSLWIVQMIRNSEQLIASGDATAVNLYQEYNHTRMPSFALLPDSSIQLIIEYIDLASEQKIAVPATALLPATP